MKNRLPVIILTAIIVALAGLLVAQFIFIRNQATPTRGVAPLVEIAAQEPDSAQWGVNFPNQYSTWEKTGTNATRTTFGGSVNFDKLAVDPRLVTLFAGYPFSKGYTEDRGHANALQDVRETARVNEKTPGTCYSCKASENPGLWGELGMEAYDKIPFS